MQCDVMPERLLRERCVHNIVDGVLWVERRRMRELWHLSIRQLQCVGSMRVRCRWPCLPYWYQVHLGGLLVRWDVMSERLLPEQHVHSIVEGLLWVERRRMRELCDVSI